MKDIMKKLLIISLAALSLNAMAQDKVLLSCTTYGDALSEVQVLTNANNDQKIRIIEMDLSSKTFPEMMPTFLTSKHSEQTLAAA
jgi:hypothetical protein